MKHTIRLMIVSVLVNVTLWSLDVRATLTVTSTGTVAYAFSTYDGMAAPADWTITGTGGILTNLGLGTGSSTTLGIRAYTNSLPTANRALGFLGGTTGVTNYFADLVVSNNTGFTLTSLTLSFEALQYRVVSNGRVSSLMFTDLSGLGLGSQTFSAITNLSTGAQNPPLSLGSYNQTLTGLSVTNGQTFTLRWQYDIGGPSGSAQGLALDNVQLTVIPEPSTSILIGLALLPVLFYRPRR
jgi:hypothetical protein